MPEKIMRTVSEQALLESEARTRAILDAAVDAIITIDEIGMVESMNPAAERLFGYQATEVIGQNVKMLMPEPYRHEHDGYLENYRQTGQKKIIGIGREVVGLRKDGTTFPMHLAVSELHLGHRRMFTGIARDITDLQTAIRELEHSEARTRAILDAAVDAILTIDRNGDRRVDEPGGRAALRLPVDRGLGQNVKMLMPEPYRQEHDGYLHNYLTTGQKKIIGIGREVVGLRKDGTTFPMHLAVSELHLGDRRMFTGIARDITDLRTAIHQLEDSEARTRADPRRRRGCHPHHRTERQRRVDEPGGGTAVRLPVQRGHRPERQDAHARAVPARARRLPEQLPDHRPEEDHRHWPRGGRPAQGRHHLPHAPRRQRAAPGRPPHVHRHRPRHHRPAATPSASSRTARPGPGPSWKRPSMRSSPSTNAAGSSR